METNAGAGVSEDPGDRVEVRRYRPADRADVLALDEVVWDRAMSGSWFAWKYERNPYLSEPAVFLAEADGRVVGARPFMAFRLRAGDESLCALQATDTMVHPEYRGRGIFTRMNRRAIDHYADLEPELCFNFPNQMAWPGYRKLGWRAVDERTTYYRVQNPTAVLDGRGGRLVGHAAGPALRALQGAWTRTGSSPDGFAVEREEGVPEGALAELYRRRVPEEIHARRDEEFYRWRYASPVWRRHAYVASENGDAVAGLLARTRTTSGGVTVTQVADVVPLVGGPRWSAAVACLLDRVVADHPHSDVLAAHESPLSGDLLLAYGFLPDSRLPLSRFASHRCTFAVRPLVDLEGASWDVNGYRLTNDSNWLLSFGERDTS
ncbi:GNAT family N-acetyltransferase [Halorarum salinum]|uniref:GNAT family N-acetyltransferase n=1 Tax=Halorarum salinum TaxID=2743089 RepID=A0A7D5QAP0_9EURY|nr:GNAT family N-acetyltransferase [Halobaculum salinum]QLG61120.1 GNAT family N-acetyltransferase [Halobaculum salinum]